jgi:hypothetical protein
MDADTTNEQADEQTNEQAKRSRRISPDVLAKKLRDCEDQYNLALERAQEYGLTVNCDAAKLPQLRIVEIRVNKVI